MARDYSKKDTNRRSVSKKRPKPALFFILFFMAGYLTASLYSPERLGHWFTQQKIKYSKTHTKTRTALKTAHQTQLPKPKFEFYTLLTNEGKSTHTPSFNPPVTTATAVSPKLSTGTATPTAEPAAATVKSVAKTQFTIQVASFRFRSEAERLQASLILKGYDVHIAEVSQAKTLWHRVLIGPYPDRKIAEKAQITIANSEHFNGVIHKVGV